MKKLFSALILTGLFYSFASAQQRIERVETIVLSVISEEPNEKTSVESLVIKLNAENIFWQLNTHTNISGNLELSKANFEGFSEGLLTELRDYRFREGIRSTRYVFTILGSLKVIESKEVGDDFFETTLKSSILGKPIFRDIIRNKKSKGFYINAYLTTPFRSGEGFIAQ